MAASGGAEPEVLLTRPFLRRPRIRLRQGLAIAAGLMTLAVWVATFAAMQNRWQDARQRASATVTNLASALIWQVHNEILAVDRTMRVVISQWKDDPANFDPAEWRTRSALLGDVSEQIIILDKDGRVVSSTRPHLVGTDLHAFDFFQVPKAGQGNTLYVGPTATDRATGHSVITFARELPNPDNNFVGVVVATIDANQFARTLSSVDLGPNGLVALIGPGPFAHRLFQDSLIGVEGSIANSQMWAAAQADPQGLWVGPSALDGQQRIHAFRRLSEAEPQIVVGLDYVALTQEAMVWRRQALMFGVGLTILVLSSCALLARQLEDARHRERLVGLEQEKLARAYQELARAKALADAKTSELQATIAGMSDGLMMLDGELRLVQWNQHYPDYVGIPRDALRVGMPMQDILRLQVRAGEFGEVDENAEVHRRMVGLRTRAQNGTIERNRPNGRVIELRRSALPGGGFVTLYTDITPRKQAEALQLEARRIAEQAAEAKSRFVAIVSHEIRTPLNAVLNALSMLAGTGLAPSQQTLADRANEAGDALLHLLNDILEMSKMEIGHLALRPAIFPLRPLLEGVQEMFRAEAAERGITVCVEMAPGAPERMRGDPGRLRQILMNLVSNAVKYTRPGEVSLVAESRVSGGRLGLRLAVRDAGPAIAPADAGRLFQPFVRLENATVARNGGTGLGLTICKRLTELMGGTIGLASVAGGNEFWVALPVDTIPPAFDPAPPPGKPPARPEPVLRQAAGTPHPPRTRILLVDDVPANQLVTATMLRREGHLIDVAHSGPEALAMVQNGPYDLVLMDVFMPGMSGLEAAQALRALPGAERHVPIVALTANVSLEDRAACLEAGMVDMLAKPVRVEQLQDAIARHVWSRRGTGHVRDPGTAEAAATGPRLDVRRITELRNSLPAATFPSMVENCLADLRQRLPQLHQALAEGAAPEIEAVAHAMAGVAGTYGLIGMRRLLSQVTTAARARDPIAAGLAARGIEGELADTARAVRAFVLAQA
jgi:signal transduction histidine kinase/CheY-like chemotaxis protein